MPATRTRQEFEDELRTLIEDAEANGIDVSGGYEIPSETGRCDWEVQITAFVGEDPA